MTNFRYTTALIEVCPNDTSQGKRIRVVHRYQEYPDSYFVEAAAARDRAAREEQKREELKARIQAARDSGASSYDLGNGMRMVFPNLIPTPSGVQPRSMHVNMLPVTIINNFKQLLQGDVT